MNRPTLRALLVLGGLALGGLLLGACGDAEHDGDAKAALASSASATAAIQSGELTASFELEPEGLIAAGGPLTFRAAGPFAAPAAGELPKSKLSLAGALGGQSLRATAITTGEQAFLSLDGNDYKLDAGTVKSLTDALGGASGGGFASLGLDPSAWITDATTQDDEKIGGVDTTHVSGGIDTARLLADVAKLLDSAGAGGLLTDKLREQIAGGVKTAKVDVYSGSEDHILRQLDLSVEFAFDKGRSPLAGLTGGTIKLRLRLDGVNDTDVEVIAPKTSRPLAKLPGGGLGALLGGLGGVSPGGDSGGSDDGGKQFLACLRKAEGDAEEIRKCTSRLTP